MKISYIDCHMHTPLCGHAVGEPIDYVRHAARTGIDLITFTCHVPLDDDRLGGPGIRMAEDELPRYIDWIAETADEARGLGVRVLTGIEAEISPEEALMERMDEVLARHPFDFVLGSLHHPLPAYRGWLEEHGIVDEREIIETYFRHLADGARSGRYNSIAHPDVIRIYGTVARFEPEEHEPVIREFLRAVVEEDLCLEVNTSGLTKGVYQVHPDPRILDWAAEMGARLTLGSDAHKPDSVGQRFDEVLPLLAASGFDRLHYFERGERRSIPLPNGRERAPGPQGAP